MPIKPALEDTDLRFRNLEMKVGLMALSALAGIILVIVLIGLEKDIFTKKASVRFVAEGGAGFIEGMPVKLSGFKIGRLKTVELTEGANVMATVLINRKYRRWVRDGSKARLSKEGFIGDAFIEITPGNPYGPETADNGMIPFERAGGMEEIISAARPVLEEVKEIIHYLNDPNGDIKATLANIRGFSSGLADTRTEMRGALSEAGMAIREVRALAGKISKESGPMLEESQSAIRNIEGLTLRLDPVIGNIEKVSAEAASAANRLPALAGRLEKTLDNVKGITDILSAEAPVMREMINDAGAAASDTKAAVKGIRESWPVRLLSPPRKKPEFLPLDSYLFEKRGGNDAR
ncbi:MAG: MCE family protein [Deltaproteobacteria bacterium]|nr:MCE family protein [Deltaproteobacteria bacterium]